MLETTLRIGTAGWGIPSRHVEQMPGGMTHLHRYASRLHAVEINSSFYRPHQRKTYERWAQSAPRDFRFSVKVPKSITHESQLNDCEALLDRFVSEVTGLGEKLGVLLIQLPPSHRLDKRVTRQFLRHLRMRIDTAVAFEPRHGSWFKTEIDDWLAKLKVSRVAADPAPTTEAHKPGGWAGLAYYRWHGSPRIYYSNYDETALASLRKDMEIRRRDAEVWCIFDNTASGAALGNALELARSFE
jgi:uncharacterized protein YecE (DUF72 family)